MKNKFNTSVSNLLNDSSDLGKLALKVKQLEQINKLVSAKLPPEMAKNCQVANLRQGTLILATTSPAWKHQLRFLSMDILTSLRTDPRWAGLTSIESHVTYLPQSPAAHKDITNKAKPISAENLQVLQDLSKTTTNKKLAEALERLAKSGGH